jgi:hypothetical protein
VLVAGSLGLSGADQAGLAGDLGGQVPDRDGAVTLPQRNRLGGRGAQRLGLGLTELARLVVTISRVSRPGPAANRARGSA